MDDNTLLESVKAYIKTHPTAHGFIYETRLARHFKVKPGRIRVAMHQLNLEGTVSRRSGPRSTFKRGGSRFYIVAKSK